MAPFHTMLYEIRYSLQKLNMTLNSAEARADGVVIVKSNRIKLLTDMCAVYL